MSRDPTLAVILAVTGAVFVMSAARDLLARPADRRFGRRFALGMLAHGAASMLCAAWVA